MNNSKKKKYTSELSQRSSIVFQIERKTVKFTISMGNLFISLQQTAEYKKKGSREFKCEQGVDRQKEKEKEREEKKNKHIKINYRCNSSLIFPNEIK